jgi:cytochrome c-type biogenesis protein CcmH/NrfF
MIKSSINTVCTLVPPPPPRTKLLWTLVVVVVVVVVVVLVVARKATHSSLYTRLLTVRAGGEKVH